MAFAAVSTIVGKPTALAAASGPGSGTGGSPDHESPGASTSVQSEIEALRTEINAFRSGHDQRWIDEPRRDEIRVLVAEVVTDAQSRTSFGEGDFTAGWNQGFGLVGPDGSFSLRLSGEVQLGDVVNHREGDVDLPRNPPATLWGEENRRTRLRFSGRIGDPSIRYRVQATVPPAFDLFRLEFGLLRFVLSPEFDVEIGRYSCLDQDSAIPVARNIARYDGVTVGWNWSFSPQVKLTMDWGMNFASLGVGEFVSTAIGYRVDEPGRGPQWAWRTQVQLLFRPGDAAPGRRRAPGERTSAFQPPITARSAPARSFDGSPPDPSCPPCGTADIPETFPPQPGQRGSTCAGCETGSERPSPRG